MTIGSSAEETTIRVPVALRDQVRIEATARGIKQSDVIALALRELQQADFLRRVAEVEWGQGAQHEAKQWDDAELAASLDPWEPQP